MCLQESHIYSVTGVSGFFSYTPLTIRLKLYVQTDTDFYVLTTCLKNGMHKLALTVQYSTHFDSTLMPLKKPLKEQQDLSLLGIPC